MKMKNLKINAMRSVLAFMLVSIPVTACGKVVDCDVEGTHAHVYTNDDGYVKFIEDEHETVKGFTRTDVSIELTKEDQELYEFLNSKGLLSINDNLDILIDEKLNNQDYLEYRYSYIYMQPIPHIRSNGKTTTTSFTYIPVPRYSWTSNENHGNKTGETRVAHYVYRAYKVVVDDNGKYKLVASDYVDDIRDIMEEYPYFKLDHSKTVNPKNLQDLDYEDGPEEETEEVINESKNTDVKELTVSYKGLI